MRTAVKPRVTVKKVSSQKELKQAFRIRIRVFVREQGVPAEIELDSDDKRAVHFVASTKEERLERRDWSCAVAMPRSAAWRF